MMRVFGLKFLGIVALASFMAGGVTGGTTVWKWWDIASTNQKIKDLETQLKAKTDAEAANNRQRELDQQKIGELQKEIDDALGKIGPGPCFTPADTDGVRQLWAPRTRAK